jgi:hypothetical protein
LKVRAEVHVSEATHAHSHVFIVRIGTVPEGEASHALRGSVEHVPTRRRRYLSSLAELDEFIQMVIAGATEPVTPAQLPETKSEDERRS